MTVRWLTPIVLAVASAAALPACRPRVAPPERGIDVAGMDRSTAPGDDFYTFTNGAWVKATAIPADKSRYGSWAVLGDQARQRTVSLIQGLATAQPGGSDDAGKIGDFYSSYMDEEAIEAKGIAPLAPLQAAIDALVTKQALARAIGGTLRADVDPLNSTNFWTEHLFGVWITQGLADPAHNVVYLLQGGIGMPDRDYYVSATPHMVELRAKYHAHVLALLKLAGLADAPARAARVVALETKIAQAHATRLESEDVHAPVSWTRDELAAKAPGLDWPTLLQAAGLADARGFIVWHPKAVAGLSALVASEPIEAWKDWLKFHAINQVANLLPKAFVDEQFAFYGTALNGTLELRPRWQRGVDYTSAALGDAVGKVYVDRYFPYETKAKVQAMVDDIVKAFAARIDTLTWMSPATKMKAKEKLATLKVGVGYPDMWRNYSALEVVKGDALGNAMRADLFEYRHHVAKLHQPVDRSEWWISPHVVNALNLPLQNALNFPAAILQPPFFDPKAGAAYNYGSLGAIIGHEISHSFDDQGSQFDAEGRLANWWTKEDLDHFNAAGEALAAQFNGYRPFPDLAVNGHQTLSENIADVAGLSAAFDAYHTSLSGGSTPEWQTFTGDQQFFISFGQSWRTKVREPALRQQIATDGHAPDQYRADTVRNLDAWYAAFPVQPAQRLFLAPTDRVHVW